MADVQCGGCNGLHLYVLEVDAFADVDDVLGGDELRSEMENSQLADVANCRREFFRLRMPGIIVESLERGSLPDERLHLVRVLGDVGRHH